MPHLTESQINQFRDRGYLVVDHIFDPSVDFAPIFSEYAEVLDRLAQTLYNRGEITSLYSDLPFGQRLTEIYRESGQIHSQHFNPSLPPNGVKADTPYWTGPALFQMLRHPNLLDVVESILGPEIYATPILHLRIKTPEDRTPRDEQGRVRLGRTLIHQDQAGIPPEADETQMITVWFPMNDATVNNGCLCVWPGSHHLGLLPHFIDRGRPSIPTEHLKNAGKAVPVPVKSGSILLMHQCLVHASYANRSPAIRWSFDIRYTPTHQPPVREFFPGFIARSRSHPDTELRDSGIWNRQWQTARQNLAQSGTPQFHRWIEKEAIIN